MKALTRSLQASILCLLFTALATFSGRAADNSATADLSANKDTKTTQLITIPLGINSTSRAVAMDLRNSREVKISLVNASVTAFGGGTGGRAFYGGDFSGTGTWYCVATPDTLCSVDTTTGAITVLGNITGIPVPVGSNTSGLAWDFSTNTMYMCNLSGGIASLYTLNLATRVATPVGQIITGTVIDIACSNTGQIYGIKFASGTDPDSLISINKTTGAGTTIGSLGVNVNFAHGLDFDPATDSLFYPGYIGSGVNNLYRINTSTGLATLVAPLAAGEYDCFAVIGQPPSGQTCSHLSSQWATGYPNLPAATYFQASDWLGDTLYVQAPTNAGAGSTTIYKYTLGGPWTTGTPLPAAKVGGSLTKCGSKLYYIGGGTAAITTGTTDVYEYDPATGAWTTKAPLPVALSAHGAVCWGDSVIFVIGGPYTGAATNLNVYYYRPASNTWGTILNSLPANQGRRTFGHGISGNKIIMCAGYNVAFLKSTYIGTIGSDASQITWAAAPDVPTAYAGLSRPGGTAYGDYFYLVCGERAGAGGYYDTTHVFKVSTGAWTYIVNNKPVDMSNIFNGVTAKCVADTVRVFVPGGYGGVGSDVFDVIAAGPSLLTDVKIRNNEVPTSFTLKQNYPNPFNPSTTIQFQVPTTAYVTLRIFNVLGQEVATLVSGQRTAGTYQVLWDGRTSSGATVASGVYFYSLMAKSAGDNTTYTNIKRMLLLK